jgi:hypothetical protein
MACFYEDLWYLLKQVKIIKSMKRKGWIHKTVIYIQNKINTTALLEDVVG